MWKKLTLVLALVGALALAGCAEGEPGEEPGGGDLNEPGQEGGL